MRIFTHKKIILFIFILFSSILFYCWDIITGYWKLNTLCTLDAGSRVYEPIERNVGWMLAGIYKEEEEYPSFLPLDANPAFIRYIRDDKKEFDIIKFISHDENKIIPSDKSRVIRYIYSGSGEHLKGDKRFWKINTIIIDADKGIIVASHTNYSFVWTLSRWLFNYQSPSGTYCANAPRGTYHGDFLRGLYKNDIYPRRIFR